jgi:hypothetical protein
MLSKCRIYTAGAAHHTCYVEVVIVVIERALASGAACICASVIQLQLAICTACAFYLLLFLL